MSKIAFPLTALFLFAMPLPTVGVAHAAPPTNTGDNLAACRGTSSEDPNIAVGQCLGFVQTLYLTPDEGWIPHYCAGFQYYEPEAFAALYDDLADCIVQSRHD